jgi:23S rRNA pseudouridine1911/1915/1917 synthase
VSASAPEIEAARAWLADAGVLVLLEDNHLLALSKPPGLLAQGGPAGATSLVDLVGEYRRRAERKPAAGFVGLVHRLDRNASGAMVVAKTSKAAARLAALFRERSPALAKEYLAWVVGIPDPPRQALAHRLAREGRVTRAARPDEPDAREARLSFALEGRGPRAARLRVRLETGLPHQIRCQLALVGHPLHGDPRYGGPRASRLALHAARLAFPHPVGGDAVEVVAPVPPDLRRLDADLRVEPPVS